MTPAPPAASCSVTGSFRDEYGGDAVDNGNEVDEYAGVDDHNYSQGSHAFCPSGKFELIFGYLSPRMSASSKCQSIFVSEGSPIDYGLLKPLI